MYLQVLSTVLLNIIPVGQYDVNLISKAKVSSKVCTVHSTVGGHGWCERGEVECEASGLICNCLFGCSGVGEGNP